MPSNYPKGEFGAGLYAYNNVRLMLNYGPVLELFILHSKIINWFLRRKLVMWHHPIGREVTNYNPYPLRTEWVRWAQEGYPDVDVVISYEGE